MLRRRLLLTLEKRERPAPSRGATPQATDGGSPLPWIRVGLVALSAIGYPLLRRPSGHSPERYHRLVTITTDSGGPPAGHAVDEPATLAAAACLFRSLGDPARLAILRHLALGEHRVVDLTAHLGLAQSTVSAHLACLKDCGLVESRPRGRASLFSLRHDAAIQAVLAAAERLLALTGDAVELCPRFGLGRARPAILEPTR